MVQKAAQEKRIPHFKAGDVVEVTLVSVGWLGGRRGVAAMLECVCGGRWLVLMHRCGSGCCPPRTQRTLGFAAAPQTVPENKRRTVSFKGTCIARTNRHIRSTFTLRNYIGSAGAVERTFPL